MLSESGQKSSVNSKYIKHTLSVILENEREIQQVDLPGETKGWKS